MKLYRYNKENKSFNTSDVSYETKTTSFDKIKSFKKDGTIMDKNGDWYYTDVKELWFSNKNEKEFSGVFSIKKLNQNYSLILYNAESSTQLYEDVTKIFKSAVNYKYSNVQISRKDVNILDNIFKDNNMKNAFNVGHAEDENEKIKLSLSKSLSLNLPETYFTTMKPSTRSTTNMIVQRLKYLSINPLIFSPNSRIRPPTRKNLAPRLMTEAMRKTQKSILNAPAEIVKTLYGIGVNPAMKIAQKSYVSNSVCIL